MNKGILYYTDNHLENPIYSLVQRHLLEAKLPVTSASFAPIDFGDNEVVAKYAERGYPTMVKEIISCLKRSKSKYVFFCEHDVLYHKCHFDFTPREDDVYYYNLNNWRWEYPNDKAIRYDGLSSLSQMCCSRELALNHFERRLKRIEEIPEQFTSKEPSRARAWGYEPGTKRTSNGGFSDEKSDRWHSEFPNIDIRHKGTFSPPKTKLSGFKHLPTGWEETTLNNIPGWSLKELFNL
jgi:hypothetical protein